MVFPTAPKDAAPFVGEGSQGGLEAVATGFALVEVGAGPNGVLDGFLGPLDKGLPGVFVAAQAAVDFAHLAALVGDGSDAHGGGKRFGVGGAFAEAGKRDVESGREGGAGAGQGFDRGCFFLGGKQFGNGLVVARQSGVEGFELIDQNGDFQKIGDGFVRREQHEVFDHGLTFFPAGFTAAAVFVEEGFEFGQFGFKQGLGRGPVAQEGEVDRAPDVFVHEGEGLRLPSHSLAAHA